MKFLSTCCLALAVSFVGGNVAGCNGGNSSSSQPLQRNPTEADPKFDYKKPPKPQPTAPQHAGQRK
jgi:hypothetical protein